MKLLDVSKYITELDLGGTELVVPRGPFGNSGFHNVRGRTVDKE